MKKDIRHVGLDVDSEKIAVAVAEPGGEVRSLGAIPNRDESVRRLVKKLGPARRLRVCYEAGPHGYVLYWQLSGLGVHCDVVAPTLVPVKAGDRVKTNRRDAEKLARCYRSGDLTAVWVPDAAHEALRDLVRAREAAKKDQLRARHRLGKFLLRHGLRAAAGMKSWTEKHLEWVKTLRFERAGPGGHVPRLPARGASTRRSGSRAWSRRSTRRSRHAPREMRAVIAGLQALRGIKQVSAATIVAEVGPLSRFARPKQLMGYSGMVSSEHSSGRQRSARSDHQDRQRSPAPHRGRGGVGLSAPARDVGPSCEEAPGGAERGGEGDRLEGAASTLHALPSARGQGKAAAEGHHRDRTRAARLHLGDRHAGREGAAPREDQHRAA